MAQEEKPIAWSALESGATVVASDGAEIGRVVTIVADEQKDIFSGITFRSGMFDSERFIPAERVGEITEAAVRVNMSADEANELEAYEG